MMFKPRNGRDIPLIRHSLSEAEREVANTLAENFRKGLPLEKGKRTSVRAIALAEAITLLLDVLSRSQTAAVVILDGSEHLSSYQVSALRRRQSVPERSPKWLVGSIKDTRPEPKPNKDGGPGKSIARAQRFLVKTIAPYLVTIRPDSGKLARMPILEHRKLPAAELPAAEDLAVSLLSARFAADRDPAYEGIPAGIIYALLDLVTMLALGTTAYMLVLDHEHLADAADPRAFGKYTYPAATLAKPSARTQRQRQRHSEKLKRVSDVSYLVGSKQTRIGGS